MFFFFMLSAYIPIYKYMFVCILTFLSLMAWLIEVEKFPFTSPLYTMFNFHCRFSILSYFIIKGGAIIAIERKKKNKQTNNMYLFKSFGILNYFGFCVFQFLTANLKYFLIDFSFSNPFNFFFAKALYILMIFFFFWVKISCSSMKNNI